VGRTVFKDCFGNASLKIYPEVFEKSFDSTDRGLKAVPRRMYLLRTSIPMSRMSSAAASPLAVSEWVRSHTETVSIHKYSY
jgi:hypothetical protein